MIKKLLILTFLTSTMLARAGNWAGYACTSGSFPGANNSITMVTGQFYVPDITTTPDWRALDIWLGIDGYGSRTVQQIGIECVWSAGMIGYYLWHEMYPKQPEFLWEFPIQAGDLMTLTVTANGSTFTLYAKNESNGAVFSINKVNKKASKSSAEWMLEDTTWPVTPFSPITWFNCKARVNGVIVPISSIPRKDGFSQIPRVSIGSILADGLSFTATYQ